MRDVFILGAGFSKAVNPSMPLLKELSAKVRVQCGEPLPPPLSELGDNIELWMTYLSQSQPWLKEYHNLKNRALFLRMTEIIGEILNHATSEATEVTALTGSVH